MLFGTFRNPRDFAPAAGFYDGASARGLDMLRFRDVATRRDERPAVPPTSAARAAR